MRHRPSSRLLVLSPDGRILLFYFEHASGPLAGKSFWATPGGAVGPGENYETAARRELREEVNPLSHHMGAEIARRAFVMQMPDGEEVLAEEAYFLVRTGVTEPSKAGWTPLELEVMKKYKWWSRSDIAATKESIYPADILAILDMAKVA
jgi:ADP-ribose pyrophosphatase YjhB (NUDIX family)